MGDAISDIINDGMPNDSNSPYTCYQDTVKHCTQHGYKKIVGYSPGGGAICCK